LVALKMKWGEQSADKDDPRQGDAAPARVNLLQIDLITQHMKDTMP